MRIGFISTMSGNPWGGSEELWAAAAKVALQARHEVVISVPRWPEIPPRLRSLQEAGAAILRRRVLSLGRLSEMTARVVRPFAPFLATRPDVVFISQSGSYDLAIQKECGALLHWLEGSQTPYVLVCQYLDDAGIPRPEERDVILRMYRGAKAVAFVADGNLQTARRHLADAIANGIVVRNPVNLANLDAIPWPAETIPQLACVVRLNAAVKGLDVLLEALGQPMWRQREYRLRLFGRGSDENYLQRLLQYYGLTGQVELAGHVDDVRQIWAKHHLLIIPSRSEGTPLALVEAMLCGRPAMVTDIGGNREWVEESVAGFIADAPTSRGISAALGRAWDARDHWATMGISARQRALQLYDPDAGRTLLSLLPNIIKAAPAHRTITAS